MKDLEELLKVFPTNIYNLLKNTISKNPKIAEELQEIRIRVNKPILLKIRGADILIEYNVIAKEIMQILEKICENSIYAYQNQICQGFITIKGGHRIGITGTAVMEKEKVINLKYITSLNFRIARQVINCSKKILSQIIDVKNNEVLNTLIVSPPGKGKTTMLRDIIRNISNGIEELNFNGKTCRSSRWKRRNCSNV